MGVGNLSKFGFIIQTLIAALLATQACMSFDQQDLSNVSPSSLYNTYDSHFFTVEYPTDWEVKEEITTYSFYETVGDDMPHLIMIEIFTGYPYIQIINDYDSMENGTLDEETMHFLSTLKFKI
ncbi:MAG: hypothetical protein ACFFKA_20910 [Candidatus Thorarchaeota archaeon]